MLLLILALIVGAVALWPTQTGGSRRRVRRLAFGAAVAALAFCATNADAGGNLIVANARGVLVVRPAVVAVPAVDPCGGAVLNSAVFLNRNTVFAGRFAGLGVGFNRFSGLGVVGFGRNAVLGRGAGLRTRGRGVGGVFLGH